MTTPSTDEVGPSELEDLGRDEQVRLAEIDAHANYQILRALIDARKAAGMTQKDLADWMANYSGGDRRKALKKVKHYEGGLNMHNVSLYYVRAYGRAVGMRVSTELVAQ